VSGATSSAPPGWPGEVPPPDSADWVERATAYLMDHCPPDYRTEAVYRRHPVVLGWLARRQAQARLEATRQAYGSVRRELAEVLGPQGLADTLEALEREGARLLAEQRAITLVADALQGRRHVPRL
jgi:hypothetical protein